MIKQIKEMKIRIKELAPEVTHFEMIKVDLSDMDSAIKTLRSEADAAHKEMLEAVARADVLSPEVDEAFSHRDFLKAEGDRLHTNSSNFVKNLMRCTIKSLNLWLTSTKFETS